MAPNFMAGGHNGANRPRLAFSNPAQDKECRFGIFRVQKFKDSKNLVLKPGRECTPAVNPNRYQDVRRGTGWRAGRRYFQSAAESETGRPAGCSSYALGNVVRIDPWHCPINNGFDRPLRSLP